MYVVALPAGISEGRDERGGTVFRSFLGQHVFIDSGGGGGYLAALNKKIICVDYTLSIANTNR